MVSFVIRSYDKSFTPVPFYLRTFAQFLAISTIVSEDNFFCVLYTCTYMYYDFHVRRYNVYQLMVLITRDITHTKHKNKQIYFINVFGLGTGGRTCTLLTVKLLFN